MSTASAGNVVRKSKHRLWLRFFLVGISMTVIQKASAATMQYWEVPTWMKVLLALSPLLPLFALWRLARTEGKADELDLRINQEAGVFAFYGMFVVLLVTDLLLKGGLLVGFVWQSEWLIIAAVLLFGLGYAVSLLRYR